MAVTRIMPWPSITLVPFITWLDAKVASLSNRLSSVVLGHIGSPVSVDSSTLSCTASNSSPSAGTSSPVFSTTMSPTTMLRRGTSVVFDWRITSTGSSSFTWLSMANSLSA